MSDFPPDLFMDLDYMDELLLDGCWLDKIDGSQFLHHSSLFDPSIVWPVSEAKGSEPNGSPSEEGRQNAAMKQPLVGNTSDTQWWIGPMANAGGASSVMNRLFCALEYIKDCTRNRDVLIQIWVPVKKGSRRFLTTNDQPFSLDVNCPRLARYREVSVNYQFPAEEDSAEIIGLPGRVFMGKVPEWTPDVQFFEREEYPRVDHAQQYDIRGTLAVPVFELGSCNCFGVIEVVMTTRKVNYQSELESVRAALEAVDLRSCKIASTHSTKAYDGGFEAALPEILKVLRYACETHGLPLAQTWVPCVPQCKGGSRHTDENIGQCVSTVDSACYISDPNVRSFHEACSDHHLLKGQGIVGRAFITNQPCFSPNVTASCKTEYPLSHHARMFGLHASVAIRLRSRYTQASDFVLEFFLPVDCKNPHEQKKMLMSLSLIIRELCRNLRVITDDELQHEEITFPDKLIIPSPSSSQGEETDDAVPFSQNAKSKQLLTERASDSDSTASTVAFGRDDSASVKPSLLNKAQMGEKRRSKVENIITLQMLRKYFAGSLKDAAKSIGVCPTTLKRICRQNGIKRWPSRKIKKVGHSLQKIQLVIDSVQGGSGASQMESFYPNFPELAFPYLSRASERNSGSNPFSLQRAAATSKSPSSGSQSSSSSQCCSSGTQQHSAFVGHEDLMVRENGLLKRARSDPELRTSNDEGRAKSHKSLWEHRAKSGLLPPLPNPSGENSQEGVAQRVKVSYGEERIRFRFHDSWRYKDLLQEIARRFGFSIDEFLSGFHLKYLDDDSDWVLLSCDEDLEECVDVCGSCRSQTIKLSLLPSSHKN